MCQLDYFLIKKGAVFIYINFMIEFLYFGIKFSKAFVEILSLEDKNTKI